MQFEERRLGDYRIFAGAIEAPQGDGYSAAIVVEHWPAGARAAHVVMRDDNLACGHRWPSAAEALAYAMQKGRAAVRLETAPTAVC